MRRDSLVNKGDMKRKHSKLERWTRWACTLIAAASALAWAYTSAWDLIVVSPEIHGRHQVRVSLISGVVCVEYLRNRWSGDWYWEPGLIEQFGDFPMGWPGGFDWPRAGNTPRGASMLIPLWLPLSLAGGASALLWRCHLRANRPINACPACGYDRSGLAESAPCPECGAAPTHQ